MRIKKSLMPWQLNTERDRWFRDEFDEILDKLGFRTKAKQVMRAAASREMIVWGYAR